VQALIGPSCPSLANPVFARGRPAAIAEHPACGVAIRLTLEQMLLHGGAATFATHAPAHARMVAYHGARLWGQLRLVFLGQRDPTSPLSRMTEDGARLLFETVLRSYLDRLPTTTVKSPGAAWRRLI